MAQSSWPTAAGGHSVADTQWESMASGFTTDGIIGTISDTTVIYGDSSGLQVKLRANKYGLCRGHGWTSGTVDLVLGLAANTSGSARIDLAVLRFDRTAQTVTMVIRPGTPGAGAPALQRDPVTNPAGLYEVAIAQIVVVAGATSISAANVIIVHPFVTGPPIIVPDLATLNLVTPPAYGTLATAGTQPYVYSSSGWLRADWNSGWGLIAGKDFASTGAALATGLPSTTEFVFNMASDPITFTIGRRYRVSAHIRFITNTTNAVPVCYIRENSVTGTPRAAWVGWPTISGIGHEHVYGGAWSETAGGTRSLVPSGNPTAGTFSIYRGTANPVGIWLEDIGPASVVTTV